MNILGISAFYHDSAAALVQDGRILAAVQEERFTRKKHDSSYPSNAIRYCLESSGIKISDIDYVVFYEKPFLKFERLLETYLTFAPRGFKSFSMAMPLWLKEKLFQKKLLIEKLETLERNFDWQDKLLFSEHHQSHAASAFFPSPFNESLVLTMDGVGEWATTSVALGNGSALEILKEIHFPHSLGLLYSAFTYYTGFKVNSGEYKVMGLAPYGVPKYRQLILDHLIDLKGDGSFKLNMDYFDYCTGLNMTNDSFNQLFGGPPRKPEDALTQRDMDLAASVQNVLEEAILRITRSLSMETGMTNLCLAGGVALNCVANGKIIREGRFKNIWIQPAAGDAGGALGAALEAYYSFLKKPRIVKENKDSMSGSFLGPDFSQAEITERLTALGAIFETLEEIDLIERTTNELSEEKAVGWFQGRMEFGPRALGARSILGDPRSINMQRVLNLKIKYRESFRPFAPSILSEDVSDWFELNQDSPYMLLVANINDGRKITMTKEQMDIFGIDKLNIPRSKVPAVTHVDYSARIHTVNSDGNPRYLALLRSFKNKTGCPMLINTSFNIRSEPMVNTPEDAFKCFMGTGLDALVIGNCLLLKKNQDPALQNDYKGQFELD